MQHTTPSTAHAATADSSPHGAKVFTKFTRFSLSHIHGWHFLARPNNYTSHMFSACEFLAIKPRFLRRSFVRGLWFRPLPPQLRILRRAPATAGRSWQAMGWTLRVEGHLQGVLGQRTPPNRSLVEDESADLLLHIYLQPIEQCMGSMHTGLRSSLRRRPLRTSKRVRDCSCRRIALQCSLPGMRDWDENRKWVAQAMRQDGTGHCQLRGDVDEKKIALFGRTRPSINSSWMLCNIYQ